MNEMSEDGWTNEWTLVKWHDIQSLSDNEARDKKNLSFPS